ncbi:hypothetical protein DINM_003238 [Dirofilaria immitis]|nr:hypothetical protein [Dirofilaria immitis]
MAEASEESDGFVIWGQNRVTGSLREHSIIWRIKNSKRMGEDYNRQVSHRGHMLMVRRKDALKTLGPSILEILFNENPLNELVVEFLSDVRYILVSETDAAISDIAFLISHSILLNAFSFRNNQKTISDEDFEGLLPALSEAQIRLIDINGSCPTREFELIVKNLNMTLVRFHRYPGIDVEMFENTKVLNSAVEFVVAQGINPSADNSGIRFLKHLKNVFPAIRNIYWDWDMMMPTLTCLNDDVKACLDQLVGLYKKPDLDWSAKIDVRSNCQESQNLLKKTRSRLVGR